MLVQKIISLDTHSDVDHALNSDMQKIVAKEGDIRQEMWFPNTEKRIKADNSELKGLFMVRKSMGFKLANLLELEYFGENIFCIKLYPSELQRLANHNYPCTFWLHKK